jgi:hypothetical protein
MGHWALLRHLDKAETEADRNPTQDAPDPSSAKGGSVMTMVEGRPQTVQPGPRAWYDRLLVPQMWATLGIAVMWIAVLFDGIYGGDIYSTSNDGNSTRIPSAVLVALFAFLGTAAVAKRAFGQKRDSDK